MLERQSALMAALEAGGRDGADGKRRCRMGEVRGWSLIQAAAFASTIAAGRGSARSDRGRASARQPQCGSRRADDLSHRTRAVVDRRTRGWTSGSGFNQAIGPEIGAVTDLSHSRTRIFIEGERAADVLKKGVPLDFDAKVFKPGQAALTGLHHTPVLIHRIREDRFEIYAMRTFAHSVWDWLTDAALEFGYDVASEAP